VKFNKIKISKISPIYTTKTKISKNFPISLSKIGEISPRKKNIAQVLGPSLFFFCLFFGFMMSRATMARQPRGVKL
jgi:hypothetical protein